MHYATLLLEQEKALSEDVHLLKKFSDLQATANMPHQKQYSVVSA